KARADHADLDIEIESERPARGRRNHGRRVPGRHVGRSLGRVHVFSPGGQAISQASVKSSPDMLVSRLRTSQTLPAPLPFHLNFPCELADTMVGTSNPPH